MKRIIVSILMMLMLVLVGCTVVTLVKTEVVVVDAIVTKAEWSGYGDSFIYVEYDGARNQWQSEDLYNKYKDHLGATIKCNLIIRTYDNGVISKTLVYDKSLTD